MPRVKTEAFNKAGFYTTDQVCEKLICCRSTLDTMRKGGLITRYIRRGQVYGYDIQEILQLQKRMIKRGGVLG